MKVSPKRWTALVINIIGSAAAFPGAVYCLANSLSQGGISILHISTFNSEVFLVQEQDSDKACMLIRKMENPKELSDLMERAQQQQQSRRHHSSEPTPFNPAALLDESITVPPTPPFKEGFELCVLPRPVMVARFTSEEAWVSCSNILIDLMLYDERYSFLERSMRKSSAVPSSSLNERSAGNGNSNSNGGMSNSSGNSINGNSDDMVSYKTDLVPSHIDADRDRATFMWGLWKCQDELTLLLDEADFDRFPEGALDMTQQRWRVVKLCGRAIEFDETGIVSAMSKLDNDIPSLNISTSTTNCTLVPEELLEDTIQCLTDHLGIRCSYAPPL